ncbi:helix-turn-helix transcriptional regulator [Phreatobacter stygius]|uniref:WYL domain-containing protein n=1 Tax=Phreatobacter stygius TaxID=1940610 RepID=A0A4D7AYX4_9HYPH|nr:WYL domain-containing protein [Phreatobacter stygius]QCI63868.1 WYL domain-containing protein [Phreatobacter stygius]
MRRADRLIDLLSHFRGKTLVTADALAERLEVSVRTVYRDIATLQAQGFPIDGQAGVGYVLRGPVDLPPLTFDHDQLEALALGLAYVVEVGDPALAAAAAAARAKIDSAWTGQPSPGVAGRPLRARQRPDRRAPTFAAGLRAALRARRLVAFDYVDAEARQSRRTVRPLALTAFSDGWMLIAWCELRTDFRTFRLDRMREPRISAATFADEPGRDLASYLAARRPA